MSSSAMRKYEDEHQSQSRRTSVLDTSLSLTSTLSFCSSGRLTLSRRPLRRTSLRSYSVDALRVVQHTVSNKWLLTNLSDPVGLLLSRATWRPDGQWLVT